MEDLSDISLNFDNKLSSVQLDDLYTTIDDGLTDCAPGADMSRPSSTLSFASWTFSPIADDDSKEPKQDAQGKHSFFTVYEGYVIFFIFLKKNKFL